MATSFAILYVSCDPTSLTPDVVHFLPHRIPGTSALVAGHWISRLRSGRYWIQSLSGIFSFVRESALCASTQGSWLSAPRSPPSSCPHRRHPPPVSCYMAALTLVSVSCGLHGHVCLPVSTGPSPSSPVSLTAPASSWSSCLFKYDQCVVIC